MDNGTAFEKQLARVLVGAAGPARPTDVAAILNAVAAPQPSRLGGIFGATKTLAAAAVVALVGGFLVLSLLLSDRSDAPMVGVSPSPTATASPDLAPPDLTTELVAPGIARVTDDGVEHQLGEFPAEEYAAGFYHVAVDGEEHVWVYDPMGSVFRVGQPGTERAPAYDEGGLGKLDVPGAAVTGATWGEEYQDNVVRVAPGAAWGDRDAAALAASLREALRDPEFMGYPDGVWEKIAESDDGVTCELALTSDGTVWGGACGEWGGGFGSGALARLNDGSWEAVRPFAGTEREDVRISDTLLLAPTPDGGLWVAALARPVADLEAFYSPGSTDAGSSVPDDPLRGRILLRLDDDGWSAYPWASVGGEEEISSEGEVIHAVDAAGRIWIAVGENIGMSEGGLGGLPGMATLLSFDGESTSWHHDIGPIRDLVAHPDGSIWVAARDGVFIIDPEAAHDGSIAAASAPRYAVTDRALASFVTSEVEPFVIRVDHDGFRQLSETEPDPAGGARPVVYDEIAAGADGSVWLLDDERLTGLGRARDSHAQPPSAAVDFEVHEDGTVWYGSDRLQGPAMFGAIDDESVTVPSDTDLRGPTQVEAHPDGTIFGAWRNDAGDTLVAAMGDSPPWRGQPRTISGPIDDLYISDGEIWARQGWSLVNGDWDESGWRNIGEPNGATEHMDVSTSGAVALVRTEPAGDLALASLGERGWSYEPLELPAGLQPHALGPFAVSPTGDVWMGLVASPTDAAADGPAETCAGVARLTWRGLERFLAHECVGQLEIAIDGAVWLQTGGDEPGIYVIRP